MYSHSISFVWSLVEKWMGAWELARRHLGRWPWRGFCKFPWGSTKEPISLLLLSEQNKSLFVWSPLDDMPQDRASQCCPVFRICSTTPPPLSYFRPTGSSAVTWAQRYSLISVIQNTLKSMSISSSKIW
jgi:hypothetical protein